MRAKLGVAQLDEPAAQNQCLCDVLIRRHLVGAESKHIKPFSNCKPLDGLSQRRCRSQMDVEFPALSVLENQVRPEFGFAGSLLTRMGPDLLHLP